MKFHRLRLFCCLLACLGSLFSVASAESRLVTQAVDVTKTVALEGNRPGWATNAADSGAKAAGDPFGFIALQLNRTVQQEAALKAFLDSQQNPASPNYHHWITPQQMGELYGPAQADVDAVVNWLRSQGLRVTDVSPTRTVVTFSGSTGQLNAAFQTELHNYKVNGETWIAPATTPQVPAALSPVIHGVHGLFTVRHYPTLHQRHVTPSDLGNKSSQMHSETTGTSSGETYYYMAPGDFAKIYDINSVYSSGYTGTGQRVAIIGQSRVYTTDITDFIASFGVSFAQPTVVIPTSIGGVDPGSPCTKVSSSCANSDQSEQTLDVERVGSTAYGADIDLVVSAQGTLEGESTDGLDIALYYATNYLTSTDKIMSMSYGTCESPTYQGITSTEMLDTVEYYNSLYETAAAAGVSFFVSSGDSGVNGCGSVGATPSSIQYASPNLLCSSGYVTCVGGTEFNDTSSPSTYWSSSNTTAANGAKLVSALSYIPEGAWNEPTDGSAYEYASSGGGVSAYMATPSWQTGTGVPSARAGRYTPDIAFSSAGHDGYLSCFVAVDGGCGSTNGYTVFSGTSAAAPSMAGITALLNQRVGAHGNINPTLYTLATSTPTAFHDVTVSTSGVTSCTVTVPSMCNNTTPSSNSLTGGEEGYLVTAGYDEVTGLGSLDVANLMTAVVGGVPGYTASIASIVVTAGQTATGTITLSTTDGFDPTQVTFNAMVFSALPAGVSAVSITPVFTETATNTYTATFTLATTSANGISRIATAGAGKPSVPEIVLILFSMMLFFGFQQQKAARRVSMLLLLLVALISLGACSGGSSSSSGSSTGTYTITATISNAASGSNPAISQSPSFTLTVQ